MIGSLAASFVGTSCWLFVAYVSVTCVAFLGFCRFFFVFRRRSSKTRSVAAAASQAAQTLAFFHPYANSGGGGERVLWLAVKALIETKQRVRIVIFTGDTDSSEAILKRTRERFGVSFDDEESAASRPVFVRLKHRRWIEAASWPRFTMIGQSIGSMVLAVEALLAFTPDVFVDTTGFAFSFPVAWLLAGCKVGAYVHYPTISTDMLKQVVEKRPTYNNDSTISSSGWRTKAKLAYYHFFALLYRLVGRCSHVVMANSSWTGGHIRSLWGKGTVVYPPCDVSTFTAFPLNNRARVVVSVSQYRPEKDQQLQIRALHALHAASPECKDVSLVLIGSCRHADDHQIADGLESLAASLGLAPSADQDGNEHSGTVRVLRNLPYAELKQWLARATAGIHTMCVCLQYILELT